MDHAGCIDGRFIPFHDVFSFNDPMRFVPLHQLILYLMLQYKP